MNSTLVDSQKALEVPLQAGALHLHVLTNGLTEEDVAYFNAKSETENPMDDIYYNSLAARMARAPHVLIGGVSWSRAVQTGEDDGNIPPTVYEVWRLLGDDCIELDDSLLAQIMASFHLDNPTNYEVGDIGTVADFLMLYRGHKVFRVTW